MKELQSGEVSVLYDGKRAIADLATPEVKDQEVNFLLRTNIDGIATVLLQYYVVDYISCLFKPI
jgi:hypothetical protein